MNVETNLVEIGVPVSGADPKVWVSDGVKEFLLKSAKPGNELSIYSEYVCSRFMSRLGFKVQEVDIIQYRGSAWAKCSKLSDFKQFISLNQSSLETDKNDKYYCMDDILYEISKMSKLSISQRYDMLTFFKRLFVADAITGNRDRHAGNWGYSTVGGECVVFDNGASLFPSIGRYLSETTVRNLLYKIVIQEPKSSVRFKNSLGKVKKNNFYYILENTDLVLEEIEWIKNVGVLSAIEYAVHMLPLRLKRYYHYQLYMRYMCIIHRKAFNSVLDDVRSLDYVFPESVESFCGGLLDADDGRFEQA